MRRLLALPLLLLAATVPFVDTLLAQPAEAKKYALLVGVNEYEHAAMNGDKPLQYAEADVTALKALLEKSGYVVDILPGPKATRKAILEAVAKLDGKGNARGTVLVAVAGHGVQFEKDEEAYFCPYDTKVRTAKHDDGKPVLDKKGDPVLEPVPESCVKLGDIVEGFRLCPAGSRILLADCCRNDPKKGRGRGVPGVNNWDPRTDEATAVLLSCSKGQRAFEDPKWGHGAFFYHVLAGLRDGKATVGELNAYLATAVPKAVKDLNPEDEQDPQPRIKSNKVSFNLVAPPPAKADEKTASDPTVYALLIADVSNVQIGESCEKDLNLVKKTLESHIDKHHLEISVIRSDKSDSYSLGRKHVREAIRKLGNLEGHTLVCYFSGFGAVDSVNGDAAFLDFRTGSGEKSERARDVLYRSELLAWMRSTKAQLRVLMTDAATSYYDGLGKTEVPDGSTDDQIGRGEKKGLVMKGRNRTLTALESLLYRQVGEVDISSSSPGQVSLCQPEKGCGIFTHALTEKLPAEGAATWADMGKRIVKAAQEESAVQLNKNKFGN